VLDRAGEAAPVWALAPRGSRELPASALQKPIDGSEVVRPCGLRRLRGVWGAALRLFRDAYENCGGLQNQKRQLAPLNTLLVASKPPRRLHTGRGLHAAEAAPQ